MPVEVTLPMILQAHHEGQMQDVHTAVPATIVSWNKTKQTATVQPSVRKPIVSADGIMTYVTPPQIQNVPCYVQRGGGFLVSVPFVAGDPVWLMFSEQSYAEYLSTGQLSSPKDVRRHGTGYPFAIPGPAPDAKALADVADGMLVIGLDGQNQQIQIDQNFVYLGKSATNFVALANLVNSELTKIATAFSTANAPSGGGPVTYGTPYTTPGNVSATITKAK